jgi:hypothetical protein
MVLGGEKSTVQYSLIKYVPEVGWSYVKPDEIMPMREVGK